MATNAKVTCPRIEWSTVRDRIALADVVTTLLGPASKRNGRRLLWCCPFHDDHDPSFEVDLVKCRWKCWVCGLGGDAPAFVMRFNQCGFPEAVCWLAEQAGMVTPSGKPARPRPSAALPATTASKPAKARDVAPKQASGLPVAVALALVESAEKCLWMPERGDVLAYLHGRGLRDETIRRHRLGWTARAVDAPWKPPGHVIPWFEDDRLALVKIRPPEEWREQFP
jgi:DNA primase